MPDRTPPDVATVRQRLLRIGWTGFVAGMAVSAGVIVVFYVAFYGFGCAQPEYGWGANRTALCHDFLQGVVGRAMPVTVCALMIGTICIGTILGLLCVVRGPSQRLLSAWLVASTVVYFGVIAAQFASSISHDQDAMSVAPISALVALAPMALWFSLTGIMIALVRAARRRRSPGSARA